VLDIIASRFDRRKKEWRLFGGVKRKSSLRLLKRNKQQLFFNKRLSTLRRKN
jgi:hypothetical protein